MEAKFLEPVTQEPYKKCSHRLYNIDQIMDMFPKLFSSLPDYPQIEARLNKSLGALYNDGIDQCKSGMTEIKFGEKTFPVNKFMFTQAVNSGHTQLVLREDIVPDIIEQVVKHAGIDGVDFSNGWVARIMKEASGTNRSSYRPKH